ncbi:MAG: hypothetical protein RLZZ522_781, partial [Verrucomicrobiota bacterium]
MSPTASYILSLAVPLQRLYITGRDAIPANTLSAAKLTNAIAAASFKQDCNAYTTAQLIAALSEYDPVVRNDAAVELGTRTLTTPEVDTLLAMAVGADANGRMGACQTLGILQTPGALTLLGERLSDPDLWVRAKAATALRNYSSGANGQRDTMLAAFAANATDPEVIVWNDPIQIANNFLSFALFGDAVHGGGNIAPYTISASKSLLYTAVQAGLKQPDSNPRLGVASFANNYLTLAAYGDAARWTLPTLNSYLLTWNPASSAYTSLLNTIAAIDSAITAPTLVPGLPVANPQVVTTEVAQAITLTGYDSAGDALTYAIVTLPAHGDLTGTPPNMTYTPHANYNGTDSFTFTVSDGTITSAAATVSLTITPVNDATLANVAATYASYTATLNGTVTCDEVAYSIYAYWGTTDGGSTAAQWQNSALVGTRSNVTASALSQPVTGLTANTRYYFTFRAVSAAGELWA